MTSIATKNGSVIVKEAGVAERCECCGCQCEVKPEEVQFICPVIGSLINQSWNGDLYTSLSGEGVNLFRGMYEVGGAPAGAFFLTLARDDSFAPFGGFGYSYSGNPNVLSGSGKPFDSGGYALPATIRCVSATARLFLFSASSGPSLASDSTQEQYRPCLRVGFYYTDTYQFDGTDITFTRTANADGLSEANTLLVGGFSGAGRVALAPAECLSLGHNAFAAYSAGDTYTDSTSSQIISGQAIRSFFNVVSYVS